MFIMQILKPVIIVIGALFTIFLPLNRGLKSKVKHATLN